MLDPALITLLKLHARAVGRRIGKGFRSARGILYFLIAIGAAAIWITLRLRAAGGRTPDPDMRSVLQIYPIVLLSICGLTLLTNGGGKAFYFTPAEVDFLFPGPFERRQVLFYKIAKSMGAALLGSLLFSCALLHRVQHWLAGYVAIVLSLIFLQMFSMTLVLASQTVAARLLTPARRRMMVGLVVIAIGIGWRLTPHPAGAVTRDSVLQWINQSTAAQVLLSPFSVFARVAASRRLLGDLPLHALQAAAIDVALIWMVIWLDHDFLESSAAHSEKSHARRMRARRGQGFVSATVATGIRLPTIGFVAGAGPLIWRQWTGAARTARATLIFFFIATSVAAWFVKAVLHDDPLIPVFCVAGWLTLFTTNLLRFDFRGDLEQMDVLKSLPVRPAAVVIGEVAAPVTILSIMHFLLLIGLLLVAPQQRTVIICAALLVVPINLLFALLENYIFLLFPVRDMTVSPGDLQGTGRRMVVLVVKMLGVLIAGLLAGCAGAAAYALAGGSLAAGYLCASATVWTIGILMVPLLGRAFQRFDPSVDTPA